MIWQSPAIRDSTRCSGKFSHGRVPIGTFRQIPAWLAAVLLFIASMIAAAPRAQAASGAAGGFATGFLATGFSGGSPAQDLAAGGMSAAVGGVTGGIFGAGTEIAPYAGQALLSGANAIYGGLVDAGGAAGQYASLFARGFMEAPGGGVYLGSGLGGAQDFFNRTAAGLTKMLAGDSTVSELGVGSGNAYSVAFQTTLTRIDIPLANRAAHFQMANGALLDALEADPVLAAQVRQLVPGVDKLRGPLGGVSFQPPTGWTWNHALDQPGVMQLVPRIQHTPGSAVWWLMHEYPSGTGGFAQWGQKY